jgi:hypothetical protein
LKASAGKAVDDFESKKKKREKLLSSIAEPKRKNR